MMHLDFLIYNFRYFYCPYEQISQNIINFCIFKYKNYLKKVSNVINILTKTQFVYF